MKTSNKKASCLNLINRCFVCGFVSDEYCGIFAQSKNCGARETAVARERLGKHVPTETAYENGVFCAGRAEEL
jgi:hypothetical protein